MKSKKKDEKPQSVTFTIKKENITKYTESFENTLNNIHALTVFQVKMFGRMGYMIKLLEQLLEETKKGHK